MAVVDVHTHMLSEEWVTLLSTYGGRYRVEPVPGGNRGVRVGSAPMMTITDGMFDYDRRVTDMNKAGVDVAVVSLTCPNAYWGGDEISLRAAQVVNDSMAAAQRTYPDRIRWMASLPWQYPELAIAELARACAAGAVGVMVLANIDGASLSDPRFATIWAEIDRRGLPVLVHPSAPPGVEDLDLARHYLVATVGFTFDTTLAVGRLIFDGFLDRYPNLKLIAAHAGGALPYLISRMDHWHRTYEELRHDAPEAPSAYAERVYFDSVTYDRRALDLCVALAGPEHVLYGSDYPHKVGDMIGCLELVDSLSGSLPRGIRGDNAERIFQLS